MEKHSPFAEAFSLPVVVTLIPVVKMNQQPVIQHISNSCHAHQRWILSVHCFQLHSHPKSRWRDRLKNRTEKKGNQQSSSVPDHLNYYAYLAQVIYIKHYKKKPHTIATCLTEHLAERLQPRFPCVLATIPIISNGDLVKLEYYLSSITPDPARFRDRNTDCPSDNVYCQPCCINGGRVKCNFQVYSWVQSTDRLTQQDHDNHRNLFSILLLHK